MAEKKDGKAVVPAKSNNALATTKKEVMRNVEGLISTYTKDGKLHLPDNYSPQNAMKAAWLILQDTRDRNGRPALEVCTNQSLTNSLLKMVIQGLDPQKSQCYFLMYGQALACQRSYFGSMALAKRFNPAIAEIPPAQVVYSGDQFEYELALGKKKVVKHTQKLEDVKKDNIVGAYVVALDQGGQVINTEIMTLDEIKAAWAQSPMKPVNENGVIKKGTTHEKFTASMCGKTVTHRLCKPIINSSDDSAIMRKVSEAIDEESDRAAAETEIEEQANTGETLEIPAGEEEGAGGAGEAPEEEVPCPDLNGAMVNTGTCDACESRQGCPEHDAIPDKPDTEKKPSL